MVVTMNWLHLENIIGYIFFLKLLIIKTFTDDTHIQISIKEASREVSLCKK